MWISGYPLILHGVSDQGRECTQDTGSKGRVICGGQNIGADRKNAARK